REAKALSLDRNDAVIRNRLRQKMAFLTDSVAGAMQPTEQELADYFEANANQYKPKPTIGFEQVFVGENPSEAEIAEVTAALGAGANPAELGARTLLPPSIPPSQASSIDGAFGKGFFEQLIDIEPDAWRSAIRSGYGVHVVRVTSRTTGDVPGLEEIRETVIRDWRGEKANEIAEAQFQRLRANYVIRLPDPADANSGKSQP
ncbi:MAG: peptidylprolyl isomerase, partial [Pseudomonadota bacterium]